MIIITVTSSASRHFSEALERSRLVFQGLAVDLQGSLTRLCARKEPACGDGCHHAGKRY